MASDILTVLITNLTDASSFSRPIDIFGKEVPPGGVLRLPAVLVDKKLRKIEEAGLISIGPVPTWYESAKKPDNILSKEKIAERIASRLASAPTPLKAATPVEKKKEIKEEAKKTVKES